MSDEKDDYLNEAELRQRTNLISVMSTRQGRGFVYGILNQVGWLKTTFHPDPNVSAFNQGSANVGVWLFSLLDECCHDAYLLMLKEAKQEENYDRSAASNGDTTGES